MKKGECHTDEAKRKIGDANKGRKHSEETKKKVSNSKKGIKNPNYGKPLSEEHIKKMFLSKIGKEISKETKRKLSESKKGNKNPMFGHTYGDIPCIKCGKIHIPNRTRLGISPPNSNKYIAGKRSDLNNQFFRSTWEANIARIMNHLNIKWEYEVKRIPYNKTKSHMIDFYLPETDSYLDIYAYLDERHLKEFYGNYESDLKIQIIGKELYKELETQYKNILPFWENGRKVNNIK